MDETTFNLTSANGFGDWTVTAHVHNTSTTSLMLVLHWIGLALIVATIPGHVLAFHDLFIVRCKPVFGKQLPHQTSHNVVARLPRVLQPVGYLLLAPSTLRPMPTEVLVAFFTVLKPVDILWHIVILADAGPPAFKHLLLCFKILIAQAALQLHLIGIMLAIPSAGAAAFAKQHAGPSISSSPSLPAALDPPVPASHKSLPRTRREGSITPCTFKGHHRLSILSASAPPSVHEAIMNLKVPSPIILTISLYVFLFVHVPLITKLAITKAFSQNWDQAVREHTLLWSAWAVWLALFGISAIVYGVQLMSVLAANEADRMESNALKGQLVSTTVGAQAANMAVAESSPAASMASHATSGTLGRTGRTSNSRDSGSPGSGPERAAAPPVKSATSPAVIDPLEAQRKLALAQVRSIVVTAPVFALVYSAIDVLNVFAYRALQQDPQVIETWLWIVPAAMHILAQGLAHADAFVGLSLVIWRERKESKIRPT